MENSYAQTSPSIEWQRPYGSHRDEDNFPLMSALLHNKDGSFVFISHADSNGGDVNSEIYGSVDIWIVKIDSVGTIIWQKCYGGSWTDFAYSIFPTKDKGYIIAGYTVSHELPNYHSDTGVFVREDAYIIKIDSVGNLQWQNCYGGIKSEYATSIIQSSDGGYVFTGYTKSNDGDVKGNHPSRGSSIKYEDAWVVKLDPSGKIDWQYCAGGNGAEMGNSIIETPDGSFLIGGYTNSDDEGFINYGASDAYVVKLSSNGGFMWHKIYGGQYNDQVNSIIFASDSGYIFTGMKDNDYDPLVNKGDLWIMQIDTLGKTMWEKSYGGSGSEWGTSISPASDGGYLFTGVSASKDGDVTGNHGIPGTDNMEDIWCGKVTSTGTLQWQKSLGGTDHDEGNSILEVRPGQYIVSGRTYSKDGDVVGNNSDEFHRIDHWIVMLESSTSSIESGKGGSNFAHAYPNPSSDNVQFFVGDSEQVTDVQFFTVMGQQVTPTYTLLDNVLTADLRGLPNGSYVARISHKGNDGIIRTEARKFIYYGK
ncbi:MAG TPA: T9SS type A sorting domain-containing protein [Candidatus Kapabacteria bacterium]